MFARRNGRTVMCESRSELPLQIQRPISGPRGEAIVTLLSPAGALFDGDVVSLEVECGPGADVVLRQTGATRLNRCSVGQIRLEGSFTVRRDARLGFLPFEIIPFAGASYAQLLRVHLEQGAAASFLEIVGPGRYAEPFAYRELGLRLEAWLEDEPVLVDAMRICPADDGFRYAFMGFSHFGTLTLLGPSTGQAEADRLHDGLAEAGICGSASLLPAYGIGARFLGSSADALRQGLRHATRHLSLFE